VLARGRRTPQTYARDLLAGGEGGVGYLLKDRVADPAEFVDAVRRVAGGGTVLDPDAVAQLLGRQSGEGRLDLLTPRELEVLSLMAEGRSNRGIAERLLTTQRAVEKHVSNIFWKLDLPASDSDHRRVLSVLAWLRASG
jgi:DNA-binding NarL/FixJ family response regulator